MLEIDPVADVRWDRFVDTHPDGSVFHSRVWLQALARTYGFRPVAYVFPPMGERIHSGQVFCEVNSWLTGRRLVSVPFSDHAAVLCEDEGELAAMLNALRSKVDVGFYRYIEIRPAGTTDWRSAQFREAADFYLHTIDLGGDIDVIFSRFHRDCIQRKIRRAKREGLICTEGRSETLIGEFYKLLLLTHQRQGAATQPLHWFLNLAEAFGDSLAVRIASYKGKPIAGMITLSHKQTLTYKYGCSDARYHSLGGVPFLFWISIEHAKLLGMAKFDLGRSDPAHQGLNTFKEHLGAQRQPFSYWRYSDRVFMETSSPVYKAAKTLLGLVPRTMQYQIEGALYKHFA